MEKNGIELNIPSYTLVMKIIGESRDRANISFANQLVQRAFKKYHSLPNEERVSSGFNGAALYASLLSSKLNNQSNDPSEALHLLHTLKDMYDESKDLNLKPDVILYGK